MNIREIGCEDGRGLNWPRIVSNGRLWYYQCWTFGF